MDPCRHLSALLLFAWGASISGSIAAAQSPAPACCVPTPYGYTSPPGANGSAPGLADGLDASGEQTLNSPFDLGESAPAQSGSSFAVNSAPNMIGNLLSNSGFVFLQDSPGYPQPDEDVYSTIAIAGGDRRFKISENMSPQPRDRVFYAFNGFQQAARTVDNREIDVNRHTLGGEKTFWDRTASIEFRMPILQGLSAVQSLDGNLQNDEGVEFGNSTIIPKFILSDGPDYVFCTGLGINLPTARNASIRGPGNFSPPLLNIQNQAVYLSPFLGLLWAPNDTTYVMSYLQADFATSGNTITDGVGNRLGSLRDQNLVHFDVTVGRFLHRDFDTRLSAIAAQLELHYTTTTQDAETLITAQGTLGNPFNRLDLLILTGGFNFELWNTSWLTVGCAVPIRGSEDVVTRQTPERPFDVELQVLFNRNF